MAEKKTAADIAGELSQEGIELSKMTVLRVLKAAGFHKTKPTRQPGLTAKMKIDRLRWCEAHRDWTLEDWKNVIWSDETSVILLHRRGGYRVWRKADERFVRSCIRERWKGANEFIFWGAFFYDKKCPCYCWALEIAKEKKDSETAIQELNTKLELVLKEEWELNNKMSRLKLRQIPGRKPQWKFTQKNGKLSRSGSAIKGIY